jgi:hypothetical protein
MSSAYGFSNLIGFGAGGSQGLSSFSVIGSTSANNTTSVIVPGSGDGAIAGDWCVIACTCVGPPTFDDTVFTGWTVLIDGGSGGGIVAKVLVGGDLGATISSVFSATSTGNNYIALIFRPNATITSFAVGEAFGNSNESAGDPAAQNINSDTATLPAIAIAHYGASTDIAIRTATPEMGGEVAGASTVQYIKYTIYNVGDTPVDHSVDMVDEGVNLLQSGFVEFL